MGALGRLISMICLVLNGHGSNRIKPDDGFDALKGHGFSRAANAANMCGL
jgi:hypothetical protein